MESNVAQNEDCLEIEIPFNLFQYLSTDNCNIHNLCRICLSERNQELFPLISTGDSSLLLEMFTALTAIHVYPNDGLPSHICDPCRANVMSCYEFKTQCLKSDCALKSLLKGEFITKDEASTAAVETKFTFNKKYSMPANVSEQPNAFEEIKKEDDALEDIQYLEDLSGSDNEVLCIDQITVKNQKAEMGSAEKDTLQRAIIATKTKGKKQKSHVCSLCSKKFRNTKALKSHLKQIHGPSQHSLSCTQCKESFITDHDLNLHRPIHEPGPTWTCVQCNKVFKGRTMFRRHVLRHMECKRYPCESCGKSFSELYALQRHLRVHTGEKVEKRHACHLCDKKYAQTSLLEAHIARHGDLRPCICAECGKAFPTTRLLLSHHRVHLEEKPHPCQYCEKRFRHESTLRTHERTHTGERPYVCATCGKRFIQNSNLTLHMRTHTGDRPYACDMCGRTFSSGSTLKSHIRTHTGEKPYECPECGKRFARMDMRAHLRLHSGERPFACGVCARRFPTPARLRDHCRVHTGEKPFECDQCCQKFSSKSHLVKHVKTHQVKKKRFVSYQQLLVQPQHEVYDKTVDKNDTNDIQIIEDIVVRSGDILDNTKEIIVKAMDDDANVTEEIIISDQETQADIQTGTLCVTSEMNTDLNYPTNMNLVTVDESGIRIASALESATVKLYQVDQSLVQIHSSGGQVTISKITSKMTANF